MTELETLKKQLAPLFRRIVHYTKRIQDDKARQANPYYNDTVKRAVNIAARIEKLKNKL
jgi:hypothetical protein